VEEEGVPGFGLDSEKRLIKSVASNAGHCLASGIGRVTAKEAARRGAKLVLAARNARDLEKAAEEIRREGGDALAVPTDVARYEEVEALARRAAEEYGRIDTWVNNAGVSLYGTFKEVSLEDFKQVVDVIFYGNVHGAKAALPYLSGAAGKPSRWASASAPS
jgi:NAD(P)-dependent dehydrogenase (short-subunit alcohol dehydrogenase family)